MSPQSLIPANQTGPVWLLCPPVSWPSVAPLDWTDGDSVTYGLLLLPVPWQIVTLCPAARAGVAAGASIARASIEATLSHPTLRITEMRPAV